MITCTPLQPILVYVFVYTHIWTTHTNPLVNRSTDLSSTLKTRHVFVPYRPSPVSLRLDSFCWIHQWYYPITWICIYKAICIICVNWNEFINLRSRIGEPGCGSSSSWEELHDQETQRSLDSADKFNRITLDCQTTSGGGSRAHSGSETIIDLCVGLFFLIWAGRHWNLVCLCQKTKGHERSRYQCSTLFRYVVWYYFLIILVYTSLHF